jgi:RNA polymerase sigma factor (sigma-70 family)
VSAERRRSLLSRFLEEEWRALVAAVRSWLADERAEVPGVVEGQDLRQRLFAAIDRLPEPQRAVFLATELEGSSFRELAERWDVPIGTLLARKHRAVKALRAALTHLREEVGGTQ